MHKAEVKDDFIKYVIPELSKPIKQEMIESSFRKYIRVMFETGELDQRTMCRWTRLGSGLPLWLVNKRLNENPSDTSGRMKMRVKYLRRPK